MESIIPVIESIPYFQPNQILTKDHLNRVVDFLEQQEHLTRQRLIGIGIVCGLQFRIDQQTIDRGAPSVFISEGVGITSEGYIIYHPAKESGGIRYTHIRNYPPFPSQIEYDPFLDSLSGLPVGPIKELFTEDLSNELTPAPALLTDIDLLNKVIILYLDKKEECVQKCDGENCDEKGKNRNLPLRVLLVDQDLTANHMLDYGYRLNDSVNDMDHILFPEYSLPSISLRRFGFNNFNTPFRLETITNWNSFYKTYQKIIVEDMSMVHNILYKDLLPITKDLFIAQGFNLSVDPLPDLFAGLTTIIEHVKNNQTIYVQYFYDFLKDVVDTYHEIREELFAWHSKCCPSRDYFPMHLMLGETTPYNRIQIYQFDPAAYEVPRIYRQNFIPSPIKDEQAEHHKRIKQLIQRLVLMIDNFLINGPELHSKGDKGDKGDKIKIISDKTCEAKLGDRKIPFYYNVIGFPVDKPLYKFWSYNKTVQNRNREISGYNSYLYSKDQTKKTGDDPLQFDICKYPKLGIEGHVGMDIYTATKNLIDIRKDRNLPFDILALKLNNKKSRVKNHFSNIFIAEDKLFSDLQSDYLTERNEFVCCCKDLKEFMRKHHWIIIFGFVEMYLAVFGAQLSTLTSFQRSLLATLLNILRNALRDFINSLDEIMTSLPENIKDFNFQKLYSIYPVITTYTGVFKYIINTWGDIESYSFNAKPPAGNFRLSWLEGDFSSILLNFWEIHLDKLGDDCVINKFYTFYYLFNQRVQTFSLFDGFNSKINGIEHIAGTNKGGTFILVYDDTSDVIEVKGVVLDALKKAIENVIISDEKNTDIHLGQTNKSGEFSFSIPEGVNKVVLTKPGFITKTVNTDDLNNKHVLIHVKDVKKQKLNKDKLSGTDKAYYRMYESMNSLAGVDKGLKDTQSFLGDLSVIKYAFPNINILGIEDSKKLPFVVVADFYLPHLIHNYKTEVDFPVNSCEKMEDLKLIDFNLILSRFKKSKSFVNFANTVGSKISI
jgi:hypothetical protein